MSSVVAWENPLTNTDAKGQSFLKECPRMQLACERESVYGFP